MKSVIALLLLIGVSNLAFSVYLWSGHPTDKTIESHVQQALDRREVVIVAKYADAAVELASDFGVTAERPATIEQMLDLVSRIATSETD